MRWEAVYNFSLVFMVCQKVLGKPYILKPGYILDESSEEEEHLSKWDKPRLVAHV